MMQTVPLAKLRLSPLNVRQEAHGDTADLEASIAAHGLLAPLIVHKMKRGQFGVLAGGRRLHALTSMAERGEVPTELPVEVIVREETDEAATEISIVENTARVSLSPVVEFEAFARLEHDGADAEAIAKRFGVTELHVRQRMRLGKLHPEIRAALREGRIGLDAAQAYAATAEPELQARVFEEMERRGWHTAGGIRQAYRDLYGASGIADMIRLVGMEAYTAAGGRGEADLFNPGHPARILDVDLLKRLHAEKMAKELKRLSAALPADARVQFGYEDLGAPVDVETKLTDAQADRRREIDERIDAIGDELDGIAEYEEGDEFGLSYFSAVEGADQARVDALVAEMRALESESEAIVDAAGGSGLPEGPVIAVARVQDGRVEVAGYYRPIGHGGDERARRAAPEGGGAGEGLLPASQRTPGANPEAAVRAEHGLSKDALEVMMSHRRATLQAGVMSTARGRELSADLLTFSTLRGLIGHTSSHELGVNGTARMEYDPPIADERKGQPAYEFLKRYEARFRAADWMTAREPAEGLRLFNRLDAAEKLEAAAYAGVLILRRTLNADDFRSSVQDMMASLAGIDDAVIRRFFRPDAQFFARLGKGRRIETMKAIAPEYVRLGAPDGKPQDAEALFLVSTTGMPSLGVSPAVAAKARAWVPEWLRFPARAKPLDALEPTPIEAAAAAAREAA